MDENQVMLSLSLLTENTKMIQSDINKLESDISTLQSTGVNVNVSNQVVANSNNPVSSGAVYTYVNQNLSSAGVTMATSFDSADNTKAVSGQLVNDYLVDNNYVTSIISSSSAVKGQVLTLNDNQGNATWETPSSLPKFEFFEAKIDQDIIVIDFNETQITNWTTLGSSLVTLSNGSAFVALYDGMYNVNISFAIKNSSLLMSDRYFLKIDKINGQQQETLTIHYGYGPPYGAPSFAINQEYDFNLIAGDELHISMGGSPLDTGRTYTLSSGGVPGEAESRITVKLNTIDNQNYPEYFLTADNSRQVVWAEAPKSKAYLAAKADVSPAGTQLVTYSPSPIITGFTMNSNTDFTPSRTGDYMVTSRLQFEGGNASGTVRVGKVNTTIPLTSQVEYDFRAFSGYLAYASSTLFSTDAQIIMDSSSPPAEFTVNGYEGAANHYIKLVASNWTFPSAFSIELYFKLGGSAYDAGDTTSRTLFDAFDTATSNRIAIFKEESAGGEKLALYIQNTGTTWVKWTFNIDFSKKEHVIVRFNGTDPPQVYVNGISATLTFSADDLEPGFTSVAEGQRNLVWLGRAADYLTQTNLSAPEFIVLVAYYHDAVTAAQAKQMYERRSFGLDVLASSSGNGTVTAQTIIQQLTTTESIGVHVDADASRFSGDAALIVHNVD